MTGASPHLGSRPRKTMHVWVEGLIALGSVCRVYHSALPMASTFSQPKCLFLTRYILVAVALVFVFESGMKRQSE